MLKPALIWLGLMPLAFLNGALREAALKKRLGEPAAHRLSTVTLLVLFSLYLGFVARFWRPATAGQAAATGALWLALTVAFEFGVFHYAAGHPWRELLADYNVFRGRLWALVPLWTAVAPYVLYRVTR